MTLDKFIKEMQQDLKYFEQRWREENAKDPGMYQLKISGNDSEFYWEQFVEFKEFGDITGD